MGTNSLTQTEKTTFYFIGVTTAKSSIMTVFPQWASYLKLGNCEIKGVDFRPHDEKGRYRQAVRAIKKDPQSIGALVTTHKIDLFNACRDLFDEFDSYARLMGEISCISKRNGKLIGSAKDPISSGLAIEAILGKNYWGNTGAEVFCMGAGGSAIALTSYLMNSEHGPNRPSRIFVSNRSRPRLKEIEKVHIKLSADVPVEYKHTPAPEDNDTILARLKPCSVVINATGLGKDNPGSPISNAAKFPQKGIAWDFNYRGDLIFLEQARRQQKNLNLQIEDGWVYFIHGWTRVIAEVFDLAIPVKGPFLDDLSKIASRFR